MKLYPRLPSPIAASLAEELRFLDTPRLAARAAATHDSIVFTATGGSRVSPSQLKDLREELLDALSGARDLQGSAFAAAFDALLGPVLSDAMDLSPNEAAKPGVWAFMGCVLAPDLVRMRFPGREGTNADRFLGRNRGIRNALGRLWWRAYVLRDPDVADPWSLLRALGEDELVGLTERTTIWGYPPLARALATEILDARHAGYPGGRSQLLRDAVKRVRRRASLVPLETLSAHELEKQVNELVDQSVNKAQEASRSPDEMARGAEGRELIAPRPELIPLPAGTVFEKRLSANEVGATGSHQGAIVVPREAVHLMPALDERTANPTQDLYVRDPESNRQWRWRYVHYNSRRHDTGTRDEYRLTGTNGFLWAMSAEPGDTLVLRRETDGAYSVEVYMPD